MTPLLEIEDVTKRFGGLRALSAARLTVSAGHAHGVIGPNGAGKTTLFNLVSGLYRPDAGAIRFEGIDIAGLRPGRIAALGIGRTFQNIRLCRDLTVLDNVRMAYDARLRSTIWSALLDLPSHRREERRSIEGSLELLRAFGLESLAGQRAGGLPYGVQRRLEIARALALKPRLLLLDEPAAGMNPVETLRLAEFLRWVRHHFQVTLVLIEHHMKLVMELCDRITVLDFGVTIADDTPAGIKCNRRVIDAYLGEEGDT
ncbi:ABC-type branched-chain amino acid transport system, ATPase component [Opitutaceae bacterium TAV1]|nr:ABC-type branched-chain amino acid transport system, ATPase component [Opitutaceae bacterium TAV1]